MTLSKRPEERVGESVLAEVRKDLILNFESGELSCFVLELVSSRLGQSRTGVGNSLLREGLLDGNLVATSVDELVVDNLDGSVVGGQKGDLIGDGEGVGKGGDVLASTGEAENHVLSVGTRKLGLALLTNDGNICFWGLSQHGPDPSRHAGVDTTAETLVGAADDDQRLLALTLNGLGLSAVKDGVGGLAVGARGSHGPGGAGELGGGDDLHGLGDLLNVLDGLETALDFTKGGVAGGIVGNERGRPVAASVSEFLMQLEMQWQPQLRSAKLDELGGQRGRAGAYRAAAAMPALRAGRAARDSILAGN